MPEADQIKQLLTLIECAVPIAIASLATGWGIIAKIQNQRLMIENKKLSGQVIIDDLTGLYIKRHFENTIKEEIARANRN